jgi:hypothetical protein
MCATPWSYIRNQGIEDYSRFNLLLSHDVQGPHFHEVISKHQFLKNVNVTMSNKDRHVAKVNL